MWEWASQRRFMSMFSEGGLVGIWMGSGVEATGREFEARGDLTALIPIPSKRRDRGGIEFDGGIFDMSVSIIFWGIK